MSELYFGEVVRLCEKSLVIKRSTGKGKEVRRTPAQVAKISKEQITLRWMISK